ncbi:hypothetical protein BSKO_12031 [Bryopsis sp. KO-2023]|nr:hypothetical protein BSKO_12031 [Bryopsis sp. KO-2023]
MHSAVATSSGGLGVGRPLVIRLLHVCVALSLVVYAHGEGATYSSCRVTINGSNAATTRGKIERNEASVHALVECGGVVLHDNTTIVAGDIQPIPIDGTPLSLFAKVGDNVYSILSIDGHGGEEIFELRESSFTNLPILDSTTRAPLVISQSKVKITNAKFENNMGGFESGGVYLQKSVSTGAGIEDNPELGGNSVVISGTVFSSNQGTVAGAIASEDYPELTVKDCQFFSNGASAIKVIGTDKVKLAVEGSVFEGAKKDSLPKFTSISGESPGSVRIKGCSFLRNDNKKGGALTWANEPSDEIVNLDLEDCQFEENSSEGSGGALSAGKNVALSIRGSSFKKNMASLYGGAVEFAGHPLIQIFDSSFQNNVGGFEGGAIHLVDSGAAGLSLEKVDFIDNESTSGPGGAILMQSGNITMTGGSMQGNKATDKGGALAVQTADTIRFSGVVFKGNSVSKDLHASGGAIHAVEVSQVIITKCRFESNAAGTAECQGNTDEEGGGAMFVTGKSDASTVSVDNSQFSKNVGQLGGALFFAKLASATIMDATFEGNQADRGGSIRVDTVADFDMQRSIVNDNKACGWDGGALYAGGKGSSFKISGSTFKRNAAPADDGGVAKIENYESISVHESIFEENTAKGSGGAVHIAEATSLKVTDSSFSTNSGESGGSLFTTSVSQVELSGSNFTKSTASTKGGAYYGGGKTDSVTITGSKFSESKVEVGTQPSEGRGGGGVALDDVPKVDISGSKFDQNSGYRGGGALLSSCSAVSISRCGVHGNNAAVGGGGVWSTASTSFSATGTSFTSNSATSGVGGAVYVFGEKSAGRNALARSRSISFSDSRFARNKADKGGGAFVSGFSTSTISKSRFSSNTATSTGGSLHVEDTAAVSIGGSSSFAGGSASTSGGAVSIARSSTVSVQQSSFSANTAKTGGAVHVESVGSFTGSGMNVSGNKAKGQGGGFFSQRSRSFSFTDSVFNQNTAENGGGMWFDGSRGLGVAVYEESGLWGMNVEGGDMVIKMDSVNFTDNAATVDGGGVLIENVDEVVLVNSVLEGNTASQGAGIYANSVDQIEVEEVTISEAVATENGGAVYLESIDNVTATSMNFLNNQAKEEGGGLFCGNGTRVFVTKSKFALNRADDLGASVMAECGCVVDIYKSTLEIEMEANGSKNDTRNNAFYDDPACASRTHIRLRNCTEKYVTLDSGIGSSAIVLMLAFGVLVVLLGVMLWMVIAVRDPLRRNRNLDEAQLMAVAAVGLPTSSEAPAQGKKDDARAPLLSA